MVISQLVRKITDELTDNARFEAEMIVMSVMGISRTELVLNGNKTVSDEEYNQIINIADRRKNGEPLQYILGETEFMSLDFYVEEGVLIPRSDTEILVETVMEYIKDNDEVLDICTGSGCIGISLAHYKNVMADLVDISDVALAVAQKNIERNNVQDRVKTMKMDILNECPNKKYNAVVSNPPYIESDVIDKLQTEVKDHEPHLALDGGKDGLIFYRRICEIAPKILEDNGLLAFEIGYNQGESVSELMKKNFTDIKVIKDLSGNDRVVMGILKG